MVVVKTPQPRLAAVQDVLNTPVTSPSAGALLQAGGFAPPGQAAGAAAERLGNLGLLSSLTGLDEVNHVNVQRIVDVTANVEGSDLGSVLAGIDRQIAALGKLPVGMAIHVRGQGEVMAEAFWKLGLGLFLAIVLVYLLMVVLFQSWMDPFIVMVAVPGALIGILWMLLLTGTTINVESFLGSIMAVGIAASNSILLVSFANDVRVEKGLSPVEGAAQAGLTRLRPVLMTATAMIIGMLPAALALGEGGEQNAPLGRAVIGGLLVATAVTLIVVPVVYSLLRTGLPVLHLLDERFRREAAGLDSYSKDPHERARAAAAETGDI
jgi:multidrug efflux pump subunit AcrB